MYLPAETKTASIRDGDTQKSKNKTKPTREKAHRCLASHAILSPPPLLSSHVSKPLPTQHPHGDKHLLKHTGRSPHLTNTTRTCCSILVALDRGTDLNHLACPAQIPAMKSFCLSSWDGFSPMFAFSTGVDSDTSCWSGGLAEATPSL